MKHATDAEVAARFQALPEQIARGMAMVNEELALRVKAHQEQEKKEKQETWREVERVIVWPFALYGFIMILFEAGILSR